MRGRLFLKLPPISSLLVLRRFAFNSLKDRVATAYFYGIPETDKWGTFPSSKLMVTFPNTNPSNGRKAWGYSYQGDLRIGMSRKEVDATLDYIEVVMQDFLNL